MSLVIGFLIGMGLVLGGYIIGRLHGYIQGYRKAIDKSIKEMESYFEDKLVFRKIKEGENVDTTKHTL